MEWYQKVLEKFDLELQRLILVADPDGILQEENILGYLTRQGFDVLEYDDPVSFRFIYESQFRNQVSKKLIVHVHGNNLNILPYDVLEAGVPVTLSLAEIFPRLSYPVLQQLEPYIIGSLYQAYVEHVGKNLGDQGTRDFVLQYAYDLVPGFGLTPQIWTTCLNN